MSDREGRRIEVVEEDEEYERWRRTRERSDREGRGTGEMEEDEGEEQWRKTKASRERKTKNRCERARRGI